MRKSKTFPTPFESGQIWQLADSRLRIGVVGRTLVHYKHYKGLANTSPVFLSGKGALEKLLQKHGAVLLREPESLTPTAGRRQGQAPSKSGPQTARGK
jgi:hypothetical protein